MGLISRVSSRTYRIKKMNEDQKPDFSWVNSKSIGTPDPKLNEKSLERAQHYLKSYINHRKVVVFGDSNQENSNQCSDLLLLRFKFNHAYIQLNKFKEKQLIQYNYASTSENITNVAKQPMAPLDVSHMQTLLIKSTDGKRELPKIFICGKYLGGVNEMRENYNNGMLEKVLN